MANKTVAAVVKLIDQFSNPSKEVNTAAKNMEKRISEVGDKFKAVGGVFDSVGSSLTKSVTAPVATVAGATAKMAMDFEESIAKVSTIADSSEVPMDKMKQSILDLSNQTGISAEDIANNVYDAISAGQKTGDAVNFVGQSAKLAKAGFADSASALDILTTTLNAYGMEASEVGRVSDILINTQNLGKTTVAQLSSTMGKIIPTAKANGVAFEQVAAGYAIMTSKGIATAETTTYMNSMMNELGKSGTTASEVLKSTTGKTFSELMSEGASLSDVLQIMSDSAKNQGKSLSDMFSSAEAGKAAMTLLGDGADAFNGTLKKMQNSTGATDEAFKKLQTNGEKLKIMLNKVKNTGIQLGTTIMTMVSPYIEMIAEKVSKATQWFSNLDEQTKQNIVKFAGIAAAVGPVLLVFGKVFDSIHNVIDNFGKLAGAVKRAGGIMKMITSPAGIAVMAIAAVAAVAILVYKNWDKIVEAFNKVKTAIGKFVESAGEKINNAIDTFKSFSSYIWETFTTKVSESIDKVHEVFENIADFLKETWSSGVQLAMETVGGYIDTWKTGIDEVIENVKGIMNGVVDFINNVFSGNWKGAWEALKDIVGNAFSGLETLVKTPINAVIGLVNKAIGAINNISVDLPSIVGGGHIGFNIPTIPTLASGTDNWKGGIAQISERGGEIVDLPSGSRVYPHDESVQKAREEGKKTINITLAKLADQIVVREDADIDRLAEAFAKKLGQTMVNMA